MCLLDVNLFFWVIEELWYCPVHDCQLLLGSKCWLCPGLFIDLLVLVHVVLSGLVVPYVFCQNCLV